MECEIFKRSDKSHGDLNSNVLSQLYVLLAFYVYSNESQKS